MKGKIYQTQYEPSIISTFKLVNTMVLTSSLSDADKHTEVYTVIDSSINLGLTFIYGLVHFLSIFLILAFYTLLERKIMGSIQRRKGPNVNGFHGLLQPLADGLKLVFKEIIIPNRSNRYIFVLSPIFFLAIALSLWSLIPFDPEVVVADPLYSVLFYLVFSTISVYGIIFAGWASNSKYPFLGALRSVAQMISYEVVLGFIILTIVICTGSLNFMQIAEFQIQNVALVLPLSVPCIAFIMVIFAETNRAPFDLAEAESELVAGYNTEYAGILFAMFFLAEYSNMITLSACGAIYFFAGWGGIFSPIINMTLKILVFMFFFVIIRAVLPRFRYDQLMRIGWRVLLPVVMFFFLFVTFFRFLHFGFYGGPTPLDELTILVLDVWVPNWRNTFVRYLIMDYFPNPSMPYPSYLYAHLCLSSKDHDPYYYPYTKAFIQGVVHGKDIDSTDAARKYREAYDAARYWQLEADSTKPRLMPNVIVLNSIEEEIFSAYALMPEIDLFSMHAWYCLEMLEIEAAVNELNTLEYYPEFLSNLNNEERAELRRYLKISKLRSHIHDSDYAHVGIDVTLNNLENSWDILANEKKDGILNKLMFITEDIEDTKMSIMLAKARVDIASRYDKETLSRIHKYFHISVDRNGDAIVVNDDNRLVSIYRDGTMYTVDDSRNVITVDKQGFRTITDKNGKKIDYYEDGVRIIIDKYGRIAECRKNGKVVVFDNYNNKIDFYSGGERVTISKVANATQYLYENNEELIVDESSANSIFKFKGDYMYLFGEGQEAAVYIKYGAPVDYKILKDFNPVNTIRSNQFLDYEDYDKHFIFDFEKRFFDKLPEYRLLFARSPDGTKLFFNTDALPFMYDEDGNIRLYDVMGDEVFIDPFYEILVDDIGNEYFPFEQDYYDIHPDLTGDLDNNTYLQDPEWCPPSVSDYLEYEDYTVEYDEYTSTYSDDYFEDIDDLDDEADDFPEDEDEFEDNDENLDDYGEFMDQSHIEKYSLEARRQYWETPYRNFYTTTDYDESWTNDDIVEEELLDYEEALEMDIDADFFATTYYDDHAFWFDDRDIYKELVNEAYLDTGMMDPWMIPGMLEDEGDTIPENFQFRAFLHVHDMYQNSLNAEYVEPWPDFFQTKNFYVDYDYDAILASDEALRAVLIDEVQNDEYADPFSLPDEFIDDEDVVPLTRSERAYINRRIYKTLLKAHDKQAPPIATEVLIVFHLTLIITLACTLISMFPPK